MSDKNNEVIQITHDDNDGKEEGFKHPTNQIGEEQNEIVVEQNGVVAEKKEVSVDGTVNIIPMEQNEVVAGQKEVSVDGTVTIIPVEQNEVVAEQKEVSMDGTVTIIPVAEICQPGSSQNIPKPTSSPKCLCIKMGPNRVPMVCKPIQPCASDNCLLQLVRFTFMDWLEKSVADGNTNTNPDESSKGAEENGIVEENKKDNE